MFGPDWIDATVPFDVRTSEWPGDTAMSCNWHMHQSHGDSVNVSAITFSPHIGTHADAPLHVSEGGLPSDSIPVSPFNGSVHVVDVSDLGGAISLQQLAARLSTSDPVRILLRTGRCIANDEFPAAWPWLHQDAAREYVARGLQLLGTDAPSVDARESKDLRTHAACFDHGAWVLENLDLRDVAPGEYEMRALPMRINGVDAAPVRALLKPVRG